MLKSELIECLESCRNTSLELRDKIDFELFPEMYGFRDGQAFAYALILDVLRRVRLNDDLGSLQPMLGFLKTVSKGYGDYSSDLMLKR